MILTIFGFLRKKGVRGITAKKLSAYAQYKKICLEGIHLESEIIVAYCEQVVWRMYGRCRPCLEAGKCVDCTCTTPGNMFTPRYTCSSAGGFPEMMNPDEWELFKFENGITFPVTDKNALT